MTEEPAAMDAASDALSTVEFTVNQSVAAFSVRMQTYVAQNPNHELGLNYRWLAVGAYVIDDARPPRILLIQRAESDSMPGRWEVPGGSVDDEDATVLHGVARELFEEAGLRATEIGPRIGDDHVFMTRSGKLVCKFGFLVETKKGSDGKMHVKLDPNEHQNNLWVTEEEIRAYKTANVDLEFTNETQRQSILLAFESRKSLHRHAELQEV